MPNLISAAGWKCYPHRSSLGSQSCSVLQDFTVWLMGIAEVISDCQGKNSRKCYHMKKTGGIHFISFFFFPLEMSASRIQRALGLRLTGKHFLLLKSSCFGTAFVPSLGWSSLCLAGNDVCNKEYGSKLPNITAWLPAWSSAAPPPSSFCVPSCK